MDPESQQPIQATDVRPLEPPQDRINYIVIQENPQLVALEADPKLSCAAAGCACSWIPIIGLITYVLNCDAPRNSPRAALANTACAVAAIITLFNIIFWSLISLWW
jgi:hypothetical protein